MKWCLVLLVSAVQCINIVLVGSVPVSAVDEELPWWKTTTLYQVYPRSFKDSDGDGVGDLKGITQNANYFREIGVEAIWLSPIYKSPMVDFGYDISDFRDIDPIFGTLDDFRELVRKLKTLDIKLILDIVPNHSSDRHNWFDRSVRRIDPYTDYYVWSDGKIDPVTNQRVPPNNWMSRFNGSAWEWREERQQYYLHLFTPKQIDFNFRNPAVVKEFDAIMTYWLDLGVDGFRIDSVMFLIEGNYAADESLIWGSSGQRWEDYQHNQILCQQGSFELIAHWEELVYNYSLQDGKQRAIFMDSCALGENTLKQYGHRNTIPFNLKLQLEASGSTRAPELENLIQTYLSNLTKNETPNWVIGNHDNSRMADRYGPDAVDAVGMLQAVLPGVKVVYYGEEIGMRNTYIRWKETVDPSALVLGPDHYLERDRDPMRTPMQWDSSQPSAGFSSSNKTWLPVNVNSLWLNVEAQRNAEKSHLKVFKDISVIRKDPVLQKGKTIVVSSNDNTLTVIRYYSGTFYVYISNMGIENVDYTTQNFFSPYGIDLPMSVEVVSINCNIPKGTHLQKGSAVVSLRPKAAVILKSLPTSSKSSASFVLVFPILLIISAMMNLVL